MAAPAPEVFPAYGSPSSRRAWVEIPMRWKVSGCWRRRPPPRGGGEKIYKRPVFGGRCKVALLTEGVGRNQIRQYARNGSALSPSSRRAWVEISI